MSVDEEDSFGVEGGGVDDKPVLAGERGCVNGACFRSDAEVVRGLGEYEAVRTHDIDEGVLQLAALDCDGHGASVVPSLDFGEVRTTINFCGSALNEQIYFYSLCLFISKDEMRCGQTNHNKKANKS